jgi:NDP-sugar pyrophosphorylase family protein
MPMGGLGSRFAKEGYEIPKPLIEVDGKPMFMRALDSFNSVDDIQHIFVIREEHDEKYDLSNQILKQLPNAKIAVLDHDTGGAVETCLIAEGFIDDSLPIAVADCDIYFESKTYFEKIQNNEVNAVDGMLLTFESSDARYSYVELDENDEVIRTAEKIVISNHAILGGYFFKTGELFKSLANQFISEGLGDLKEFYMSHLFNILLAHSAKIEIASVDTMHIFGTPEELNTYLNRAL